MKPTSKQLAEFELVLKSAEQIMALTPEERAKVIKEMIRKEKELENGVEK